MSVLDKVLLKLNFTYTFFFQATKLFPRAHTTLLTIRIGRFEVVGVAT